MKETAKESSPSCVCAPSHFPSALFGGVLAVDGEMPLPPALPIRRDASSFGMRRIGAQLEFLWNDDEAMQAEVKMPLPNAAQYAFGAAA